MSISTIGVVVVILLVGGCALAFLYLWRRAENDKTRAEVERDAREKEVQEMRVELAADRETLTEHVARGNELKEALKNEADSDWQLILKTPLLTVGVRCDEEYIFSTSYLSEKVSARAPQNKLAVECERQLRAYFKKPRRHRFDLPLAPTKTPYQQRVRNVIQTVGGGDTITYGAVATHLNSWPRAVGSACRANAIPLIVPCHRVVAADGLGGFKGGDGQTLCVKKRLLRHEGVL